MTSATSSTAVTEISEIDGSARCSLSFLTAAALVWLVLGGLAALLNLMQLHDPALLQDCALLTFGRTQALQETMFIYGWAANASMALALWLLLRMGGAPLRGANYVGLGGLFWNAGLLLGLVGIAIGDLTSFSLFQLPRYVQPLMLVAFGVMAVPAILAWTGRRKTSTYATQWYVVAALFLFPWLFSVAHVMLIQAPVRGVLQPVVATWFAQNLFSLWLLPIALGTLYYLLPKLTGKVIPHYDFAAYGFWSLLLFGCWTGGRHLIGGPVPAWIPTLAFASGVMLLFHFIIVFVNLRGLFASRVGMVTKFAVFGFSAYLLGGLVDVAFSLRGLAEITQFTHFQLAQGQLTLAAFSMIVFAGLYYLAPRLAGAAWPSTSLVRAHYLASVIGFAVLIIALAAAGWLQGTGLNNPEMTFAAIATKVKPWLQVAAAAQALLVIGNALLAIHFIRLMLTKPLENPSVLFREPPALEAKLS